MGALDFLSASLTPATQAASGMLQGKREKGQTEQSATLALMEQIRKAEEQQAVGQEREARIRNLNSEITAREAPKAATTHYLPNGQRINAAGVAEKIPGYEPPAVEPKAPVRGTPEYLKSIEDEERVRAKFKAPPKEPTPMKLSDAERKNAAFYNNAVAANGMLRTYTDQSLRNKVASKIPLVGNYMMTPDYQRNAQAAYQLSEAWLRATSGAVIADSEIRNNSLNYFPQPGDDGATVRQKARAREQVVKSLRGMAGRAIDPKAPASADANPDLPFPEY